MADSPSLARRTRAYAQRRELILETARAMAEAEGWDSVTTRRLADAIEFSQPVLYRHFPQGRTAIVHAVAGRGFADLATAMAPAGRARSDRSKFASVVKGYLDFAAEHPAVYQAMSSLPVAARFGGDLGGDLGGDSGGDDVNDAMKAVFDALATALRHWADHRRDVETAAEVLWSTLHGMATFERNHRVRAAARERRIRCVVDLFVGAGPPAVRTHTSG